MHILTRADKSKSKEHLRDTQTKLSCQKNKNLNFLFQTIHIFDDLWCKLWREKKP